MGLGASLRAAYRQQSEAGKSANVQPQRREVIPWHILQHFVSGFGQRPVPDIQGRLASVSAAEEGAVPVP
ncbi:hypothetical protein [Barnesiella intestinihominis]|uniref:hypothetical protein n=1 Tax=Barnesiella intestinihominis TaxID=487174 RepID=UPI000623A5BC